MARVRRVVFWIFVGLYLVLCPLTILSALGYEFRGGGEPGVIKTGLIRLASLPPGAEVYVNRRHYTKRTPTTLEELLPGDYWIRVAMKGRRPWERTVPVEEGRATVLDQILLLPAWIAPRLLSEEPIEEFLPAGGRHALVLPKHRRLGQARVGDLRQEDLSPLLGLDSSWADARLRSSRRMGRTGGLLARVDTPQGPRLLWLDLAAWEPRVVDLSGLGLDASRQAQWDALDANQLVIVHRDRLLRLDLKEHPSLTVLGQGVRGVGCARRMIYVLWETGLITRMDPAGRREELVLDDPEFRRAVASVPGPCLLRVLGRDRLLVLGVDGSLLAGWVPFRLIDSGVRGLELHATGDRLVVWQSQAIAVLTAPPEEESDGLVEQPQLEWVYRGGTDIDQVIWVHEASHLLVADQDQLRLIDLQVPGEVRVEDVLPIARDSAVAYDDATGRLWWLEAPSRRLASAQLLPHAGWMARELADAL